VDIDRIDRRIIWFLSGDIGGDMRPYRSIAEQVGTSEPEVIARVNGYKRAGVLRRIGAVLDHRRTGFGANGMAVWNVPDSRVDELGRIMASFREVTHCYARPRYPDWPCNLYTMVHGASEDECRQIVERIARATGLTDYMILFSTREFKKTSMRYFASERN